MTKAKPRHAEPFTQNQITMQGICNAERGIDQNVLDMFFHESLIPEISKSIIDAATKHGQALNQRRESSLTSRGEREEDRRQLIECIDELCVRLNQGRVPESVWEVTKSAYVPYKRGMPTLSEERTDLRQRLIHLKSLFEKTEFPESKGKNPGKPERDALISELEIIFDKASAQQDELNNELFKSEDDSIIKSQKERIELRKKFVKAILELFLHEKEILRL